MLLLNAAQRKVVEHPLDKPLIVVAPPGSGKTRCLVLRMERVLRETEVRLVAITFTNKAAKEMRERLQVAGSEARATCTTFHSLALRLCRQEGWVARNASIWTGPEQKKAMRALLEKRAGASVHSRQVSAAVRLLDGGPWPPESEEGSLVAAYTRMKRRQNALDFADMISVCTENLRKLSPEKSPLGAYGAVLVDEWQDTSGAQLKLVRLFLEQTRGLTVVGDPSQAIYGWRGADINCWRNLKEAMGEEHAQIDLDVNYRSVDNINRVCQSLIKRNPRLSDVVVTSARGIPGPSIQVTGCASAAHEAQYVAQRVTREGTTAILFRSNPRGSVSRALEIALMDRGIPYRLVSGQAFYRLKLVQLVLSHARLLLNDADDLAFEHVHQGNKPFVAALRRFAGGTPLMRKLMDTQRFSGAIRHYAGVCTAARERFKRYETLALAELPDAVLSDVGYKLAEGEQEIVDLLKGQMRKHKTLDAFLTEAALVSPEGDAPKDENAVVLSTIHASKGLEWDSVFVVQLCDGVLPSRQSLSLLKKEEDVSGIQEERRLLFVAMSRARTNLTLTHGGDKPRSRLLDEVVSSDDSTPKFGRSNSDFQSASFVRTKSVSSLISQSVYPEESAQDDKGEDDEIEEEVQNLARHSNKRQKSIRSFFGRAD